ncbi:hypothetical protein SporoP37_01980 [Sporosarcina sp. P37]|uniref:hypothetical protein n=1 Tax=unclassified Sporosarcina TaxID=2647733 RepID=UPI000A17AC24|nr:MULTISPECIES: hypothetical protein [unclassified Sporosarcina]ARK23581.1 hypothetical protein SporoP37_01980 [Sporosarcina sp. P37]PID18796.1 transglycosylase [Sporosarcina sp. P35]
MAKDNIVQCDTCQAEFKIELQTKQHPAKLTETYFACSSCGGHYTAYVVDPYITQQQKELKRLDERYKKKKAALSAYTERKKQEVRS